MLYLYIILALAAIGFILYYQRLAEKERKAKIESEKRHKLEILKVSNHYSAKLLDETIHRVICQMDKTALYYADEDEANRELTTCLSLLGHNARYQSKLNNGRQADIEVGNCIIEGKLDPNSQEIDRLTGQVADYLSMPYYKVYVVIYGKTNHSLIEKIKRQIIIPNGNRVKLAYIPNAQRLKQAVVSEI